jgi:ActR/RegA family two-component response regulator
MDGDMTAAADDPGLTFRAALEPGVPWVAPRDRLTVLQRLQLDFVLQTLDDSSSIGDAARRLNMHRRTVQRILRKAERAGIRIKRPR